LTEDDVIVKKRKEDDVIVKKGLVLAEKLEKATADPEVAYEFLKIIDAKILRKVRQKVFGCS